jgi:hypothetical protein
MQVNAAQKRGGSLKGLNPHRAFGAKLSAFSLQLSWGSQSWLQPPFQAAFLGQALGLSTPAGKPAAA